MNIEVVLDGVILPTPHIPFKEIPRLNGTDNEALDGTLYTDFMNQKRSWSLYYEVLSKDDYDDIREIYNNQFLNETYPVLQITYYGILIPVKMSINEKNIWNDGSCIRGVEITLNEQYAFS